MSLENIYRVLQSAYTSCNTCGACSALCEVLNQGEGGSDAGCFNEVCSTKDLLSKSYSIENRLTIGQVAEEYLRLFEERILKDLKSNSENTCSLNSIISRYEVSILENVRNHVAQHPDSLYRIRRCCMCGFCTAACPAGVSSRKVFVCLRELMTRASVIDMSVFNSTRTDQEWHIFSVYRAVYGIYYQDLPHVCDAISIEADTLFFPGCSLASYAPELTREVFEFIKDSGFNVVISEQCCQSPLKSSGEPDRAYAFKKNLIDEAREAGIKKIVFVCPGCRDEFAEVEGAESLELIPLPQILVQENCRIDLNKLHALADIDNANDVCVSVFDSCHDRDGAFGMSIRVILEKSNVTINELPHHDSRALCCGAAGSVSIVDPDICADRAHRILCEETAAAHTDLLVSNCPTCSYTWAAQLLSDRSSQTDSKSQAHANYLELIFGGVFEWDKVFRQLNNMWTGEYGAWVCQELL